MRTQSRLETLLIRADAGVQTGTGHVMRCLALAQAWARRGGQSIFFLSDGVPALTQRVLLEGFQVVPIPATTGTADIQCVLDMGRGFEAPWVVLDGYAFAAKQQELLRAAGFRVLVVDDYGQTDRYAANIVLNQNVYASVDRYEDTYKGRTAETQLLLGLRYALLRREFLPWTAWSRTISPTASRLLVTLGGSDAANRGLDVLRALSALENLEVVLLIGGTARPGDELEAEAAKIGHRIKVVRNTCDMPGWMAWGDIAVAGAGVTSYELCFMGLPSLLLVLVDNQRPVANRLKELGLAASGRPDGSFDAQEFSSAVSNLAHSPLRAKMSQSSRDLVDGLGADRVCAAMLGKELRLRPLQTTDCDLLFRWANDPQVRAVSFQSGTIPRALHDEWFAGKLSDPASVFHIGEDPTGNPVGQVRYRIDGTRATLSINVDPALKGCGWGRELLYFSTHSIFRNRNIEVIHAFVQPENRASLQLFEKAGFDNAGSETIQGRTAVHFVLKSPHGPCTGASKTCLCAISQPAYLPWLGYFDLMDQVDVFVILDSVQFEKQSWQQRNRIKGPTGLQWLTVPVAFRGRFGQRIDEVQIRESNFRRKHLRAIELNYRRTPYFQTYYPELAGILQDSRAGCLLVDLNLRLIRWIARTLGIHTQLHLSSEMRQNGKRTELLANLLESLGASGYISPLGSANHLLGETNVIAARGIKIGFQNYQHPEYNQRFPPFRPYTSVLDLLFNEGPRSLEILRSGRRSPYSAAEAAQFLAHQVEFE